MHPFSVALILLIGATVILAAVAAALGSRSVRRRDRLLMVLAGVFVVVGAAGFLGSGLSSIGGLRFRGSFEWPIGTANGVLEMADESYVVPHPASGRVQIYDREWRFVRGWYVDAGGGAFKLLRSGGDRFDVVTARGTTRYTYTVRGDLVSRVDYAPASYSSFPAEGARKVVPTPPWLLPFTSPFGSWAMAALGVGIFVVVERAAKRRKRRLER